MLITSTLLLLASGVVLGYPEGAPMSTCDNMLPRHGGSVAQASQSPFTLATGVAKVAPGAKVTVTLAGDKFKGFLMMALDADTKKVVGKFTKVPSGAKKLNCGNGKKNAVTQSHDSRKNSLEMVWKADSKMANGTKLIFRATVLQSFQTYWTNVDSPSVVVSKK